MDKQSNLRQQWKSPVITVFGDPEGGAGKTFLASEKCVMVTTEHDGSGFGKSDVATDTKTFTDPDARGCPVVTDDDSSFDFGSFGGFYGGATVGHVANISAQGPS